MQRKRQWWYAYKSPNFKLALVATNPFTNLHFLPRFNPRNATRMKSLPLCVIILAAFAVSYVAHADRGDDILSVIQSEALEAHIVALQENIKQGASPIAYRTRSAHNREASDNAAEYIAAQLRRSSKVKCQI